MSKLVKFSPKRDSLLKKLKQELAPETPGFRTLCPDEPRRGVEIVVEDLHKTYVNSLYIYEGCPKMPYNCIISLKSKTNISLIHMHSVGKLFLDMLLK